MSRHEIQPLNERHTVTVGYDRGMKTYFAQVIDTEIERLANEAADRVADDCANGRAPSTADVKASEKEAIIFWIGADKVNAIPTVEDLGRQLAPYAFIEPDMTETLREDQRRDESTPRTSHQNNMLDFIQRNGGGA